ncbi:MAG: class I SAM-dependent methyltransferase [Chloroflexota bacterium]
MAGKPNRDLYQTRPDLYDLMHEDQVDDARFVRDYAATLIDGARVIELGCGTGRLLLPLLESGASVTGMDREPAMLKTAADRLGAYGDRLTLVEGDMTRFEAPGGPFDVAIVGLNTFMHLLTIRSQLACLMCIHQHLRPGGSLMLDLASPHAALRDTQQGVVLHRFSRPLADNQAVLVTLWSATVFSTAKQLAHTTLLFDEVDGESGAFRRTLSDIVLRLTYRYELEHLLGRAGFTTHALYGDYESSPYEDESERLICIAAALA